MSDLLPAADGLLLSRRVVVIQAGRPFCVYAIYATGSKQLTRSLTADALFNSGPCVRVNQYHSKDGSCQILGMIDKDGLQMRYE